MIEFDALWSQPAARALGWALAHFVWQGSAIAFGTAALLALCKRSGPDVRYLIASTSLALMLTVTLVTGWTTYRAEIGHAASIAAAPAPRLMLFPEEQPRPASATLSTGWGGSTAGLDPARLQPLMPAGVALWAAGVLLLSVRLICGWLLVQRLRHRNAVPASARWQAALLRISRRLHVPGPIRLLESSAIDVPTVIGWISPVVLLPVSALSGLSPQQLEAILAHELAHVRRHDYLVNLLQSAVETLLFYHPAVWWLSSRIRAEREHCCDDVAVNLCGDAVAYAGALVELEALRGSGGTGLAMAATGGSLLHRVRRLLGVPSPHADRSSAWMAGVVLSAAIFAVVAVGGIRVTAVSPVTAQEATAFGDLHGTPPPHDVEGGETAREAPPAGDVTTREARGKTREKPATTRARDVAAGAPAAGASQDRDVSEERTATLDQSAIDRILAQTGRENSSDYDRATLLIDLADDLTDDESRRAYLVAAGKIRSDYERRRALDAILWAMPDDAKVVNGVLALAPRFSSEYERAELLIALLKSSVAIDAATLQRALDGMDSDHERRRAMTAVLKRKDASRLTASMLSAAADLRGDYERAEFLIALARAVGARFSADERAHYVRLAEEMSSEHEQKRALEGLRRAGGPR